MAEPCITQAIWDRAMALGCDIATAQGRAAFDLSLRQSLQEISDASLRGHAAQILRDRRAAMFREHDPVIAGILHRLDRLEGKPT
jgi:hypothetical protein